MPRRPGDINRGTCLPRLPGEARWDRVRASDAARPEGWCVGVGVCELQEFVRTRGPTMGQTRISRRTFMGRTAAATAVFNIVPRHVLGGPGHTPPSDVITRGVIGTGGRGTGAFVKANEEGKTPVVLAVCDVDKDRVDRALKKTERACEGYTDFRRVLERKDIDTVCIATPPHWHSLISIAAAQAGKDILCEKPLTCFIGEGQAVIRTVEKYGRILQIGTYGRFHSYRGYGPSKELRKLVTSGLLGSPVKVRVSRAHGFNWKVKQWSGRPFLETQAVPDELDYDMWLGPAPFKPYHRHRTHGSFRGYWDYDGGGLADMGQHYLDPVQYLLEKDDTSPVEIEAVAPYPPHPEACGKWGRVDMTYADGCKIILETNACGPPTTSGHPCIEGPKGKVFRGFKTDPTDLKDALAALPDPPRQISDFNESIVTRNKFGLNEVNGNRSNLLVHLANCAIRTGRKLKFDPVKQRFIGDEEANRLADQPMRAPWHL